MHLGFRTVRRYQHAALRFGCGDIAKALSHAGMKQRVQLLVAIRFHAALDLPRDFVPQALVTIGRPAHTPPVPPRKPLDAITAYR